MNTRKQRLSDKEMELVKYLMADCKSTGDIQGNTAQRLCGRCADRFKSVGQPLCQLR